MDKVTPEDLMTFLWVAAALIAFVLAIWTLLDKITKAKKPAEDARQWKRTIEEKLDNDNRRITTMMDGQKAICRGVLALLNHEITGNSVEKLKDAQTGLTTYLINK